ncbi:DUF2092 domain-containing protein [Catalinimonas sp. 4WD22]|uniref:DUF2092 domain-containing protein n=1 Tax=Catalinimonas locisalis TaxID=3133978 RepID=UPI0031019DFC
MKKYTIYLTCILLPYSLLAQEEEVYYDPIAVLILDRMSEVIGDLNSCSFTLHTSYDLQDSTFFIPIHGLGLVKYFSVDEVYLVGPDKMLVNSNGDRGHRGYWYSGDTLTFYSYTENNFARVDAPDSSILETIYTIHDQYGIDFPAADFFNPYFTDDLLFQSNQLLFMGSSMINGKDCFRIIAAGEDKNVQLWISNDALTLPQKMVIVYLHQEDSPQYEVTFSDWQLNPDLPSALFEFSPPPRAAEITLVPKNAKAFLNSN